MRRHLRTRLTALLTSAAFVSTALAGTAHARAGSRSDRAPDDDAPLPAAVDGGAWRSGHLQGIALDRAAGRMYFSFTNLLVKTDLQGRPLGSVTGITGHLGDLDVNPDDGRVYGSLEYKTASSFYVAIFDGARITRMGMDARSTGVLTTVHLEEVADDYAADMNGDGVFDGNTGNTPDHRYGCSGIDGLAFGPDLGRGDATRLTVAYGVYANSSRTDNDHQVLLQYEVASWHAYERPLTEDAPHASGPAAPAGKFFAYTGNTTYGVQNLAYDADSGNWLMAAYRGKKPAFPNYSLFVVDGEQPARWGPVRGQAQPERGRLVSLVPAGLHDGASGVHGYLSAGQYGLVPLGDGRHYVAEAGTASAGGSPDGVTLQTGRAVLHRWTGRAPDPFAPQERSR
ncbi:hypothetical protein ACH41E_17645 [Streptomyces sp. NPDC020412]|uniref:hypothetical protein n=1 Tax=Streptomyces sp. NPDC020412 TaxID=3365073 RepID=UPI0037A3FDA7